MAVTTKPGVVFKGFTFPLLTILDTLVWLDTHPVVGQPPDLVITSGNDSAHKPKSKHYENLAVDVRAKSFPDLVTKTRFVDALRKELGPTFTVLHECVGKPNEHFHLQAKKKA